jgi:hypothetical protein
MAYIYVRPVTSPRIRTNKRAAAFFDKPQREHIYKFKTDSQLFIGPPDKELFYPFRPLKPFINQAESINRRCGCNNYNKRGHVDHKLRHKRVRLLVKKANKQRKQQAKKIDILCNNLIAAQRDFINKLKSICFTAHFYESIMGADDLYELLYRSSKLIKEEVFESNTAFFLRQGETFELHIFERKGTISTGQQEIENSFTPELVDNICKANKICTIDDMLAMGLCNLNMLNKISAATVPLRHGGLSAGFILIYRRIQNKLTCPELDNISAVSKGLSEAIVRLRAHAKCED